MSTVCPRIRTVSAVDQTILLRTTRYLVHTDDAGHSWGHVELICCLLTFVESQLATGGAWINNDTALFSKPNKTKSNLRFIRHRYLAADQCTAFCLSLHPEVRQLGSPRCAKKHYVTWSSRWGQVISPSRDPTHQLGVMRIVVWWSAIKVRRLELWLLHMKDE